jgi:acyl dehydratase
MSRKTFEDFPVGTVVHFRGYEVTEAEIIAFARAFDPQPMHLDPEAAQATRMKGLTAPGMLNCSMVMRLYYDGLLADAEGLGAPGLDETRWLFPVRPGMVLSAELRVTSARVSRSRPDMGLVGIEIDTRDQTSALLMTQRFTGLFARRDTTPPPPPDTSPKAAPAAQVELPCFDDPLVNLTRFAHRHEDVVIGARVALGSKLFTREDIIDFASKYDPQPFHLSDEGAATSHFGRLAASGWHTAANYMRRFIDTRDHIRADAASLPFVLNPGGPSPGFRNLRWLRPVHAGDTITYDTTVIAKEQHPTRPNLGVARNRATGVNQNGVKVFEIEGSSLTVV